MTRSRRLVFALALGLPALFALFSASGCAGALMMPYYLIYGTDAPAVFKDEMKAIPKESKMVVICRSNLNLFGSANPNADLAQSLTYVISTEMKDKKKKKLVWIPFSEVEDKFDEEEFNSQSFEKMGKALGADYVIGVEIDSFEIHHSTQFYQGSAKVLVRMVRVEDCETVIRQSMPNYVYPPTPVPSADLEEIEFQKTYTVRLARNIATLFCPHDPHAEYAADSDFPER
ncbi:MAG: hypothetical protein IJM30_02425 [Thermoguttaceae bacterium]|nr:hypothetical protein [Thermoguttaceae bacterium]